MKEFLRKHWKKILFLFSIGILILGIRSLSDHSLVIGNPSNIIVISPEHSQDVIVIGDPDKISVKPKNKTK